MKIKITKLESVTRQLDQAIELFFFDKDIISCLTLVGASRLIALDLAKHSQTHTGMQSLIKTEMIGEFENAMRKEQNFFKHAERDGFSDIEFEAQKLDWLLIDAIIIYEQIPDCKLTKNMSKFQMYFISNYPHLVDEKRREIILKYLGDSGIPDKMFIWEAFEYGSSLGLV